MAFDINKSLHDVVHLYSKLTGDSALMDKLNKATTEIGAIFILDKALKMFQSNRTYSCSFKDVVFDELCQSAWADLPKVINHHSNYNTPKINAFDQVVKSVKALPQPSGVLINTKNLISMDGTSVADEGAFNSGRLHDCFVELSGFFSSCRVMKVATLGSERVSCATGYSLLTGVVDFDCIANAINAIASTPAGTVQVITLPMIAYESDGDLKKPVEFGRKVVRTTYLIINTGDSILLTQKLSNTSVDRLDLPVVAYSAFCTSNLLSRDTIPLFVNPTGVDSGITVESIDYGREIRLEDLSFRGGISCYDSAFDRVSDSVNGFLEALSMPYNEEVRTYISVTEDGDSFEVVSSRTSKLKGRASALQLIAYDYQKPSLVRDVFHERLLVAKANKAGFINHFLRGCHRERYAELFKSGYLDVGRAVSELLNGISSDVIFEIAKDAFKATPGDELIIGEVEANTLGVKYSMTATNLMSVQKSASMRSAAIAVCGRSTPPSNRRSVYHTYGFRAFGVDGKEITDFPTKGKAETVKGYSTQNKATHYLFLNLKNRAVLDLLDTVAANTDNNRLLLTRLRTLNRLFETKRDLGGETLKFFTQSTHRGRFGEEFVLKLNTDSFDLSSVANLSECVWESLAQFSFVVIPLTTKQVREHFTK